MPAEAQSSGAARAETVHPLFVRVTHWINAFAIFVMILSGWRIYNASPLYGFEFPPGFTLGGWLAGALAWHFAAMWLLALNGIAYLAYGLVSGHFRKSFLPVSLRGDFAGPRDSRGRAASITRRAAITPFNAFFISASFSP